MIRHSRTASFLAALFLAPALWGCQFGQDAVESPVTESPLIEKLPLTVGIHYPPGTRDYFFELYGYADLVPTVRRIELGPPSMRHFDRIFATMFENVTPIEAGPVEGQGTDGVDAVLVSMIGDYMSHTSTTVFPICEGNIVYQFTLFGRDGMKIASWESRGMHSCSVPGRSNIESAIREATARFLIDFYKDKRVKNWLDKTHRNTANDGERP